MDDFVNHESLTIGLFDVDAGIVGPVIFFLIESGSMPVGLPAPALIIFPFGVDSKGVKGRLLLRGRREGVSFTGVDEYISSSSKSPSGNSSSGLSGRLGDMSANVDSRAPSISRLIELTVGEVGMNEEEDRGPTGRRSRVVEVKDSARPLRGDSKPEAGVGVIER